MECLNICNTGLSTRNSYFLLLMIAVGLHISIIPCVTQQVPRQLQSVECVMFVYTDPTKEPKTMADVQSCPTGTGKRAFLLDQSMSGTGNPSLREISPMGGQRFVCNVGKECSLVVSGFGLQFKDKIVVLPANSDCPPKEISQDQEIEASEDIKTSSALTTDFSVVPFREKTSLPIFNIGVVKKGLHTICYSPYLAAKSPTASDFHYKAGELDAGGDFFFCDFEEGMCGLMQYRDDRFFDFNWKRHSGATDTIGTGPSEDHTKPSEGRGYYIYMKSPGYLVGASVVLLGQPTIYPPGFFCVRLWFHMYGDDVNSLRVYMRDLQENENDTGDWGKPKFIRVGNHGDEWIEGGFEFQSYGRNPKQLVLEALAGFSEKGDIAVDDMSIVKGRCPAEIMKNSNNSNFICGEVRLISGSWSDEKSWYLEGAVSCAGRGYSYDNLMRSWMPCCVPNYGSYTVVLKDAFGDGWNGSVLEFKFLGETFRFGEDFIKGEGAEKKYTFNIGQLQISKVEGSENRVRIEVQVSDPDMYVWCGVAHVGSPPPTVDILKKYGIRSQRKTSKKEDKLRLEIANKSGDKRIIQSDTDYSVYCYTEPADSALDSSRRSMDDAQVAATKVLVTTDSTPPKLVIDGIQPNINDATVIFHVNEKSQVWCFAREVHAEDQRFPTPSQIKNGSRKMISKEMINTPEQIKIKKLAPDTDYRIYCYAEDFASPRPNGLPEEQIRSQSQRVVTQSKIPVLKIKSYNAVSRGFVVRVNADTPAKIWCAAALAGSAYPSSQDVMKVGAFAEQIDITKETELEIRGVSHNTRYSIYCFAASRSGKAQMSDNDMWNNSVDATSFGKFCELPADPQFPEDGKKTPFDPLTPTEEFRIRDFMNSQVDFGASGIYRIDLLPNKDEIYQYYESNGPFPKRFARVRLGTCEFGRGNYKQYKVGPLDANDHTQMKYEQIGDSVLTDCGGYSPLGVFGRRLLDERTEEELSHILEESFGYPFSNEKCKQNEKEKCLSVGPTAYEEVDENLENVWVGLRTPKNVQLPFFFVMKAPSKNVKRDLTNPEIRQEILLSLDKVQSVWYNGQQFMSIDSFLKAYYEGSMEKVTPEKLEQEKKKNTSTNERRLAPSAEWPGPNPRGREGLEYRVAPEHVEPQGRRFTAYKSPEVDCYTINYAGWEFIINNNRDTSLRLWNVRFKGIRLVFEMGLMEALAHYSSAERNWYFMDSWYGGLGSAARKLHPGIECPKTGRTLFANSSVCIFEQDFARPLRAHWKSGSLRDGAPHHALVVRQMLTVSNYDYITDYVFHLSGFWEGHVAFTGELYAGVEVPWFSARQHNYGTQVTGSMRMGALHCHIGVWKIDFDVDDYKSNSVLWHEVVADEKRPGALKMKHWIAEKEEDAFFKFNSTRPLHYQLINEDHKVYGNLGGFTVHAFNMIEIPTPEFELYTGPSSFATYKILTSVYNEAELDVSLPRDNKYALKPAVSLARYIEDNESVRKKDLVTWITSGIWHIPAIEDMPLTLSLGNTLGWLIKPHNYYTEDPSMDIHNALGGNLDDPGTCAVVRHPLKNYLADL